MKKFVPTTLLWFCLALFPAFACGQVSPTPTPEAPSIIATVKAMLPPTPVPSTPEAPSIIATVRAMLPPAPVPPTPEGPSIMATVNRLLATPTATPSPTNTPGPTPTPRAKEAKTLTILNGRVATVPLKLAHGERLEGYYQSPKSGVAFSIQNPVGKTVADYGQAQAANFQIAADTAGFYTLVFNARPAVGNEVGNMTFDAIYQYEIFGF